MLSESRRTLHDASSSPLGTGLSSTPPHRAEHKRRQRAVSSTPHNLDFFDSRVDNAPPVSARQPFPPTITTAFDRERVPTMPATTPVQPSGKADSSMTPAEKARERSLREDPLANVLDPSHVECRRCNKKIKLSSKSAFDTFHWRNHRARCMRTAKKKGPGGRAPKVRSLDLGRPKREPSPALSVHPDSDGRGPLRTPPLMSDSDDGGQASDRASIADSPSVSSVLHSPISRPSPLGRSQYPHGEAAYPHQGPHSSPKIRQGDNGGVDEYISRFHPEVVRPFAPLTSDHWQSWTWAQLKQPNFPPNRSPEDDQGHRGGRSFAVPPQQYGAYTPKSHRRARTCPEPSEMDVVDALFSLKASHRPSDFA